MPGVRLERRTAGVGQAGRKGHRARHPQTDNSPAVPGHVPGARGNQSHQQANCLKTSPGIAQYFAML